MSDVLRVSVAQWSEAGNRASNEDACGIRIPDGALLATKGMAAVIADGVSAAEAGREAAEACVQGFLNDYFSTPESWSVKTSGHKVLAAINRWLHGQGHRLYASPQAMVTTLSVLVVKSATAHLFHVGDTRIHRLQDGELECLTTDHRLRVDGDTPCLGRALGIELAVEIDYRCVPVEAGDVFLLTTDGVHDYLERRELTAALARLAEGPERVCRAIVEAARAKGSPDNLSCQIVRIDAVPDRDAQALYRRLTALPFPPPLEPGMRLDGYRIVRALHASRRTELYLAVDEAGGEQVVIKTPSVNFEDDPVYIDLFLHEEWVGRRLDNPHVLKVLDHGRRRQCLYYVTEYVEGQTLRQWMHDHPRPDLREVRDIVEQIARGLRAFHRLEMIHRDLKPENVMIDRYGTVKIVDFGSTKIAGIEEIATALERPTLLGTRNYTAPEYLLGHAGSNRSDIFSLGVIAYEMLTGELPYDNEMNRHRLRRLRYVPAARRNPDVPAWVDGALQKAVHPDPAKRYEALSEFVADLSRPNPRFVRTAPQPLIERDPVRFWRALALMLLFVNIVLWYYLTR